MKKNIIVLFTMITVVLSAALGVTLLLLNQSVTRGYVVAVRYQAGYSYNYYIPSDYVRYEQIPLFVVLHGGTQTADQIATTTKMNELAELYHFAVLYPQQSVYANSGYYWNWFLTANQRREGGELELIAGMIQEFRSNYNIAPNQIFAAGLSAGGCMALSLGIAYSDVISGVAIASGVAYGVANSVESAYLAMTGTLPNLETTVASAYENLESKRPLQTMVFHGTTDTRVDVTNADYIISQVAAFNDLVDDGIDNQSINDTPSEQVTLETTQGVTYTRYYYKNQEEEVILQKYIIDEMEHGWSGGSVQGTYSEPNGPDMSLLMVQYFLQR